VVSRLADLVTHTPENATYIFDLAMTRAVHGDLLREGKQNKEGLKSVSLAVSEMSNLLKDDFDPENNDNKRPEYRKALAELCAKFGSHLEAAGQKDEARAQYDKSLRLWETLAGDPEWAASEQVKAGLAAMKDKLDKLPAP